MATPTIFRLSYPLVSNSALFLPVSLYAPFYRLSRDSFYLSFLENDYFMQLFFSKCNFLSECRSLQLQKHCVKLCSAMNTYSA